MEQQMPDCELFINHIGTHYNEIEEKLKMLSGRNKQPYDKDAFQESIVKCYTYIKKKVKMKDTSPYGIESYLIRTYLNYIKEIKRSAQTAKRDFNYNSDNIGEIYERYYNSNNDTAKVKIASDLFKDFSILYIMTQVEDNFDQESFYLYRLKTLSNLTYQQIAQKTQNKGSRQKILEVKEWVKNNIFKDDVRKAFNIIYSDLIDNDGS